MDISSSVGSNGTNRKPDVMLVQELLNRSMRPPLALLDVEGRVGPKTVNAIQRFQKQVLHIASPDGLIERGKQTWHALSRYAVNSANAHPVMAHHLINLQQSGCEPRPKAGLGDHKIAWGAKVSGEFKAKVIQICQRLEVSSDYLMACMSFESGGTFSASIRNAAGSNAVGLIQFMPATAKALGTTTDALAKLSAVAQLDYVEKYFTPKRGKLKSLEDVYMAILYPAAIGKPPSHALFIDPSKTYQQNAGFDKDNDKQITLAEISQVVRARYQQGLQPGYLG
jgi:hypothetical protein